MASVQSGESKAEPMQRQQVLIGSRALPGELAVPPKAVGLVVFAHGSGSSRLSPRNRFVSDVLHGYQLATLLLDLLSDDEARDRTNVFDIALLGSRVVDALDWAAQRRDLASLRVGLFGASTGAAAALVAAAQRPSTVGAVVSRGGRPDLARECLPSVRVPCLLIVGGEDHDVIRLNRMALRELAGDKQLEIVPGATHLFEEAGTLDTVAHLAGDWFARHLARPGPT